MKAFESKTEVRYDNPLKQGLKLVAVRVKPGRARVRYDNPLKQGLKLASPRDILATASSDMTIH